MLNSSPLFSRFVCSALLLNLSISPLLADTIVLKSGERFEGKILKTTETTVEAEVKMSAAITDTKVFQKSDIASIEKPDPAEEAFAAVKSAAPGPNSRTAAEYNTAIHVQLNPFIVKYAASPLATQAKDLITALEKEKERVALGEAKIDNVWYTPAELERQKDQINATVLFQQMKSLAQSGDTLGALNTFAKLEKTYSASRAYPAAVDYAVKLLPNVQSEINTKKAIFANDMIERKKGLDVLPDFRKAPLIAAAAAEEAKANAAVDSNIAAGIKWTPIYPRNQKSIDELQKTLTAESTRLATIKTAPMQASIATVEEAKKQIAAGDLNAAAESVTKATSLWSANALIKIINEELLAAKAAQVATPTPTPDTANAAPTPPVVKTPKTAAVAIPEATPVAPIVEEKTAFFATIPGALTILGVAAVVAGGISVAMKAKEKKTTT